MEYLFRINPDRCIGCRSCVAACLDENDIKADGGVPWRRVISTETGKFPKTHLVNFSLGCMHCSEPACMAVCPEDAIQRQPNGIVVIDKTKCSGCMACRSVCPFGVPLFDERGKMQKCNGCAERVAEDRPPACVEACPMNVLEFRAIEVEEAHNVWLPHVVAGEE